jgi:hypothetical protein
VRKKFGLSIAIISLLLVGILATTVLASDPTPLTNMEIQREYPTAVNQVTTESVSSVRQLSPNTVTPPEIVESPEINDVEKPETIEIEELKELVPDTYEEVEAEVLPFPRRNRFLLYTHDGKHVMWGFVGNNYFVGTDNHGKRCWGIYGRGIFAGLYDGDFFWGKYRCGNWKAEGLFGQQYSHGKYVLFPVISLEPSIAAVAP